MSIQNEIDNGLQGELIVEAKSSSTRDEANLAVLPQLLPLAGETLNPVDLNPAHVAARKRTRSSVSLVIPAKNEARNLGHVLGHIPNDVDEVILVDGKSSDVTRLMATSCRPDIRIISEPEAGKGAALRAGFNAARGDLIIAIDADGSMSPEEIPQYIYFLENGFDLVKGSRFVAGGGSLDITRIRRAGNRALLGVANWVHEVNFTDLCYGFFGFWRKYLGHLDLCSSGFEIETEIMLRAAAVGLRIAEIPSLELPRRRGQSNLHAIRDGQRVLKTIFAERYFSAASRGNHGENSPNPGGE